MKRKIKRILSALLTAVLISCICVVLASASDPPSRSKWAYINKSQSYAYSQTAFGTYKFFGGRNYANSNHNLTICARYYDGSSQDWKFDKKIRVSINTTLNDTSTTVFGQQMSWQVYLKPYSIYTSGCHGDGYIWYG